MLLDIIVQIRDIRVEDKSVFLWGLRVVFFKDFILLKKFSECKEFLQIFIYQLFESLLMQKMSGYYFFLVYVIFLYILRIYI